MKNLHYVVVLALALIFDFNINANNSKFTIKQFFLATFVGAFTLGQVDQVSAPSPIPSPSQQPESCCDQSNLATKAMCFYAQGNQTRKDLVAVALQTDGIFDFPGEKDKNGVIIKAYCCINTRPLYDEFGDLSFLPQPGCEDALRYRIDPEDLQSLNPRLLRSRLSQQAA